MIAVALSLIIAITTFMFGCKSKNENTEGPGDEITGTPGDDGDDNDDNDDEPPFDPFDAEIYGVYLSDMDWEPDSLAGWVSNDYPQGHLAKDNNTLDGKITVKIGNSWRAFEKGLFTHAEANVYYNIENIDCKYLTAYVGMDAICGNNTNGAKFFVYTSNDDTLDENTNWTLKTAAEPTLMTRGIPATVIGQPGHAAILCYDKNSEGKGYWGIDNNVSGWSYSTKNERHLLGWGNESWQRTHATIVYFNLAQDALNDYDNYVKAEENVMMAKAYGSDAAKREELYERALSFQPINIDAWYGLVKTYEAKGATQDKYIDLAIRLSDTMVGYPLPMYDLFKVIEPLLTDEQYLHQLKFLKSNALTASSALPNSSTDKTLQPAVARGEALFLLGGEDLSVADFSFDGENGGAIVWAERFDGGGLRFKYSLDNKKTWKEVSFTANEPHVHKLTSAELKNVTEENDIYVYIVGIANPEKNSYRIDISSKPKLPTTLFANDYENKIFGLDDTFEWRYVTENSSEEDAWIPYSQRQPDCTDEKTVEVRLKATGDNPPSDSKTFTFTKDANTPTRQYVPVSRLSVIGYSSQSNDPKRPNYAANAIDGNRNTF